MKVEKLNSINSWQSAESKKSPLVRHYHASYSNAVSFKMGSTSSKAGKNFWRFLRQLGKTMNENNEIKNALIAGIGTGIIAPSIILVSPGKGDKEDKDKKALQALRQPISALLQIGFQVPATVLITRYIDSLSYKKKIDLFKDDVIGDLIPTEKFLEKGVEKETIEKLESEFEKIVNGKSLKQELEESIREDYREVELELSEDKLARKVQKKKKKFLKKKAAQIEFQKLKEDKIRDILTHPEKYPKLAEIKDIDLVSEDIQKAIADKFKNELKQIETEANLSFFDKTLRLLGFENKKLKGLKDKQKDFKKAKGLEKLRETEPEVFASKNSKIRKYVETYQSDAQKMFKNKKFGFSLLLNLAMVAASCYALNWLHPRVNAYIEKLKDEKNNNSKVEVK